MELSSIKKEHWILSVFSLLIVANVTFLWSKSTSHFQELDSALALELLLPQDRKIIKFVRTSYTSQEWGQVELRSNLSVGTLIEFVPDVILKKVIAWPHFQQMSEGKIDYAKLLNSSDLSVEIINQLEKKYPEFLTLPLHAYYRIGQSVMIERVLRDSIFKEVVEFPLASTYTPVMGIYYFLIKQTVGTNADFYRFAVKGNILLANFGLVLLFFTMIRSRIPHYAAAISVLILMYSISFYQYAFHLGSTVHTFLAMCLAGTALFAFGGRFSERQIGVFISLLVLYSYMVIIRIAGL